MEETLNVKKFISASGMTYEIGDLYPGGGPEEVITSIEETGKIIRFWTALSYYDYHTKSNDYIMYADGSAKLVKSKYDKFTE